MKLGAYFVAGLHRTKRLPSFERWMHRGGQLDYDRGKLIEGKAVIEEAKRRLEQVHGE